MKIIELVTTNGSLWRIPASIVCDNQATYYNKKEHGSYHSEYKSCMEDDYQIVEWAKGNMNWEDVSMHALLIDTAEEDMEREWGAGDMEIIDQPSS